MATSKQDPGRERNSQPSRVDISEAGATAVGGNVELTGAIVGGRDVVVHGLTVIADDFAPYGDAVTRPGRGSDVCPYPGIAAFDSRYREFFFGRDEDISSVLELVNRSDLAAIIGSSGTGKSSLLAAGAIPALTVPGHGKVPWQVNTLRPGRDPVGQLASSLAGASSPNSSDRRAVLRSNPRVFLELALDHAGAPGGPVLWVIDQSEELFDPDVSPQDCSAVLEAFAEVAVHGAGRVKVLLVLRSDYYAQLDRNAVVARAVAQHQHRVLPLGVAGVTESIIWPAERVGLRVEPALVEHVQREVGAGQNAMPLLAYALRQTWERRRNGWLTLAGYVESGGLSNAIEQGAASVWERLDDGQRSTARRVFLRLARADPAGAPTRRRRALSELVTNLDDQQRVVAVIDAFAKARLLTVGVSGVGSEPTVEVAHEALLREWPLLRSWLEADLETGRVQEQLADATAEWAGHDRDPAYLFQGRRLDQVEELSRQQRLSTTELEGQFLMRSRKLAHRQRLRSRMLVLLPLGLAAAVAVGAVTTVQQQRTQRAKTVSDAAQLAAQSRSLAGGQRDAAALLAVLATRTHRDRTTFAALVDAVAASDGPLGFPTPFDAHATTVASAFTDTGAVLVGEADGTVRQLSPIDGSETAPRLIGHTDALSAVSTAGGVAVSGDASGAVLVSALADGRPIARLSVGTGAVTAVRYDATRRVLAAASDEGTVRSWRLARDLAPGGLVDPPTSLPTRHFRSPVADIAIDSKGGSIAAVTDDGWIHRWRIGTAASVATVAQVRPGNGSRLVYLGDGMLVCIDGRDISTWSSEGIRRTAAAPGASAITVAPGFAEVWVGTDGGVLQRWWVQSTPVLVGAPRQGLQSAAVAVAAGASVVTALDTGGRLVSWDADGTTSPAVHTLTSTRSSVTAVSAGPGNAFAAIDHGGEVWLGGSGARMRVVTRLGTAGAAVAWSADGQILAAGADGAVRLVPVTGGDPTYLTPAGPSPVTAMAAHGQLIATGFSDGRVEIRTRASILAQLRVPAAVTAVAVNATATIVAVASGDGAATSITVFHERDGRFLATVLRGHTSQVASLAFNPRGSLLASGSDDRMIALWSVPSGHRVDVWKAHTDQVRGLSFDATGQTLASGSEDSTIRLWDVASRRPLGQPLRGATGFVWSLSASANGQRLVAGHGNSVEEWPLDPDGWARQACTVARRNLAPAEWSQYAPGYRITTLCPGRFSPR